MFNTTRGVIHALGHLKTTLGNGAKLLVDSLPTSGEYTGYVVSKDVVRLARYNATKVYWLSNRAQDALFVPLSLCKANQETPRLYAVKHNEVTLIKNYRQIIDFVGIGYKIIVPIANKHYGSVRINSILKCSNSVIVANNAHIRDNSVFLPLNKVIFEDNSMQDLTAILLGEELYEVKVQFKNTQHRTYSYKSTVSYNVGDKVVVDSPHDGLVVVTVHECKLGLNIDSANFEHYKWIVSKVDTETYGQLKQKEQELITKAKINKERQKAIAKLAELGITPEEYRQAILGE